MLATSPISVHAGISTLSGMTSPSSGMAAAAPKPVEPHNTAIGDLERREELNGVTPATRGPAPATIGLLSQPAHGCETLREGLAGIGLRPRSGGAITYQEAPR